MMTHLRLALLSALLVLFVIGCGGNKTRSSTLTGKVMYKGAPVTGGTMTLFVGEAVYPASLSADGSYAANQLPEGDAIATVDTEVLNPNKPKYGGGKGGMGPTPEGASKASAGTYVKIPAKYKAKATSDLKVTLKGGKQQHDFELKD